MVIDSMEDFKEYFVWKDMGRDYYFGFDVSGLYHIHAKTFSVSGNGEFFVLYDVRGHAITKIKISDVTQVLSCGADYWTVKGTLFLRGY